MLHDPRNDPPQEPVNSSHSTPRNDENDRFSAINSNRLGEVFKIFKSRAAAVLDGAFVFVRMLLALPGPDL